MAESDEDASMRELFGRLFEDRESIYRQLSQFPSPAGQQIVGAGLGFSGWPESPAAFRSILLALGGGPSRDFPEAAEGRSFVERFPPCMKVFTAREPDSAEDRRNLESRAAAFLGVDRPVEAHRMGPVLASAAGPSLPNPLAVANWASPTSWGSAGAAVSRGNTDYLVSSAHVVSDIRRKGENRVTTVDPQTGRALSLVGRCKESKLQLGVSNRVDTALVELHPTALPAARRYARAADLGPMLTTVPKVQKVGVRTGHTFGVVSSTYGVVRNVQYPGVGTADFEEVFTVYGFGTPFLQTDFSDLGDSGSIVEDVKGKSALGMIVANATNPNYGTVVCRSRAIETELSVKFR